MRRSNDEAWVRRSNVPRPVEGESEIDVILQNKRVVVFAEAKLGYDISPDTKYDPERNQIVRNIDCLLDQVNDDRVPMFWMLVRDDKQARSYVRLLNEYRDEPSTLIARLGHHDADRVRALARDLALLLWKDIVAQIAKALPSDEENITSVKSELLRRVAYNSTTTSQSHSSPGGGGVPHDPRGMPDGLPRNLRARDLIIALGWHCRLLGVYNKFAEYWHLRFELLSRAFDLPPNWHQDCARTPRMISTLAPHACSSDGFFSGFLEYTPLSGEMTITEYHEPRIKTAEANLREQFLEYGEALLLRFWPQVQRKLVNEDQLVAAGLPPQRPHAADYI